MLVKLTTDSDVINVRRRVTNLSDLDQLLGDPVRGYDNILDLSNKQLLSRIKI